VAPGRLTGTPSVEGNIEVCKSTRNGLRRHLIFEAGVIHPPQTVRRVAGGQIGQRASGEARDATGVGCFRCEGFAFGLEACVFLYKMINTGRRAVRVSARGKPRY